jgi:tRNA dimethylallyltransferase
LALEIAKHVGGEIISCDSLQVYRDLTVGTGKPSVAELSRVKHHLIGILKLDEIFSAGDMQQRGRGVIEELAARGVPAVVAGGTGFYYRALLYGLSSAPARSQALRRRLQHIATRRGGDFLVRMLERVDPQSAARIMPRDRMRIVRALEVFFASGIPFSRFAGGQDQWLDQFCWIGLGLNPDRKSLYDKINCRVERMLRGGWLEEVSDLLAQGANPEWKAFEAIGYRQVVDYLRQGGDIDALVELIRQQTRNYAKRQWTWFRREPGIRWLPGFGEQPEIIATALEHIDRSR